MRPRGIVLTVGALALTAVPAFAQQRDSAVRVTVIRASTPFEQQVEQMARALVGQQQRVRMLSGTRRQLEGTLREASLPETERSRLLASLQRVDRELVMLDASRASLRRQLEELCTNTQEPEGWLGLGISGEYTMNATPGGRLMAVRRPPEIETVEPGSPAEKAGMQRGDILLSLAGRDMSDAVIALRELLRPGNVVAARIKRGTDIRQLRIAIEPRPADFRPSCTWEDDLIARALESTGGSYSFMISSGSGRTVEGFPVDVAQSSESPRVAVFVPRNGQSPAVTLTPSSATRFLAGTQLVPVNEGIAAITGVTGGVFVAEVARRSPAAQAGLLAGDVIISADGRPVTTPAMLAQRIERSETRELSLQVVRQRRTETVLLKW